MKRSENINEIANGLSKFQGTVQKIVHNKEVFKKGKDGRPDQKYTYADLDIIWDTIRKPLILNGLSVAQDVITTVTPTGSVLSVETTLMHNSGQWIQTDCPIIEPKEYGYVPMQTLGGLITYAKRYGLCAMLGITADPDEDANETAEVKPKTTMPVVTKPTVTKTSATTPKGTVPNMAQGLMKLDANGSVRLMSVATSAGWKMDEVNDFMEAKTGKSMMKDLTNAEAGVLANIFKNSDYNKAIEELKQ